jgi:hypothetical protein
VFLISESGGTRREGIMIIRQKQSETIKGSMKNQVNFFVDPFVEKWKEILNRISFFNFYWSVELINFATLSCNCFSDSGCR